MSYLNTERNDSSEKYFKFLLNKIEIDKLKVDSNFYLINFNNIKSFLSLHNKKKYPIVNLTAKKNSIINELIEKSKLENLKLSKIKNSNFHNINNNNKKEDEDNVLNNRKKKINKQTKTHKKYLKILYGALDNELLNDKNEKEKKSINEKNIKTFTQRNRDFLNIKNRIHHKRKNKEYILNSVQIGKSIFNNCLLRNKIIYDIKPLNKSDQKGQCFFPYEDNKNKDISKINKINNSNPNIFKKNENEYKSLDYIPTLENENMKNLDKEKKFIIKEYKINRINEVGEKPLNSILERDSAENLKAPNLKTFYGRGIGDMIRGEKIKFIKTCYPVQFVKPVLTQHGYIFKSNKFNNKLKNQKIKRIKNNNTILKSFKRKEKLQIENVKEELKTIKKDIMDAFDWFEDQKKKLFNFKTEEY